MPGSPLETVRPRGEIRRSPSPPPPCGGSFGQQLDTEATPSPTLSPSPSPTSSPKHPGSQLSPEGSPDPFIGLSNDQEATGAWSSIGELLGTLEFAPPSGRGAPDTPIKRRPDPSREDSPEPPPRRARCATPEPPDRRTVCGAPGPLSAKAAGFPLPPCRPRAAKPLRPAIPFLPQPPATAALATEPPPPPRGLDREGTPPPLDDPSETPPGTPRAGVSHPLGPVPGPQFSPPPRGGEGGGSPDGGLGTVALGYSPTRSSPGIYSAISNLIARTAADFFLSPKVLGSCRRMWGDGNAGGVSGMAGGDDTPPDLAPQALIFAQDGVSPGETSALVLWLGVRLLGERDMCV